jgi:hypothetical protein
LISCFLVSGTLDLIWAIVVLVIRHWLGLAERHDNLQCCTLVPEQHKGPRSDYFANALKFHNVPKSLVSVSNKGM